MDLMDDEDLKKSVIDKMMGELDDETASSLKRPSGPAKGVEITIAVVPKSDDAMEEGDEDGDEGACMDAECEDPMHDHSMRDEKKPEDSDYISQLLKKLG
jgi:hypothetical protein